MTNQGLQSGINEFSFGVKTATAGTVINRLIPPRGGKYTRVSKVVVRAAGTAHTLTALRVISTTTASAAAASGQAVLNFTADPGTASITVNGKPVTVANAIAANDFIAVTETDGITRVYKVSSVSTLAITMTGNFTAGVASGATIWFFGAAGDTDPNTGEAHQGFTVTASAITTYSDVVGGVASSNRPNEPLLLQDDNATAAGFIEHVAGAYTPN